MPWVNCDKCGSKRISGKEGALAKHQSGLNCSMRHARKAADSDQRRMIDEGWERCGSYTNFLSARGVKIRTGLAGHVKHLNDDGTYEAATVYYAPMWAVKIAEQNQLFSPAERGNLIKMIAERPEMAERVQQVMVAATRLGGWRGGAETARAWLEAFNRAPHSLRCLGFEAVQDG